MACCEHCTDAESLFTERAARRELRRYRRKGPVGVTRQLLDALREQGPLSGSLLDIGGGIGVLQHELLRNGIERATHVDAARAYLNASESEAVRLGHRDRVTYQFGDFVELAPQVPSADVVTLDRVLCCYPDMPALVRASADRARRLYALSYPRGRWWTRLGSRAGNMWFRLSRSSFRTYIHPPRAIVAEIEKRGFRRVASRRTFVWQVEVYRRQQEQLTA